MSGRPTMFATGAVLSAILLLCVGVGCNGEDYSEKEPTSSTTNTGRFSAAGSTFIAPLFARWSTDYEKSHHMIVNYLPIGSGAALSELKENLLTFAASDAPLSDAQLKELPPLVQIPVTAGPVCVIYNLATLSAPLKLSGKTLAGIYSGQIKNWDASTIQTDNPGVKLPHTPITVVHRLDGSGTTSIFTTYLSAVSESWSAKPGHGLEVQWPVGIGQNGSRAVLAAVKGTAGAIGYGELSYARKAACRLLQLKIRLASSLFRRPVVPRLAIDAFKDESGERSPRSCRRSPCSRERCISDYRVELYPDSERERTTWPAARVQRVRPILPYGWAELGGSHVLHQTSGGRS